MSDEHKYWIGVASRCDVVRGLAQGYAQLSHGNAGPLEKMRAGDGLAFYSPRAEQARGQPLQAFTAIGRVRTGSVYRAVAVDNDQPFRIDVEYFAARPAPIAPLIEQLSFIRSKKHWGAPFRFGVLRVPAADFALIGEAMGCALELAFPTIPTSTSVAPQACAEAALDSS